MSVERKRTDPLYRRHFAYDRASVRIKRRVTALLAYIEAHPQATCGNSATLRRLDDMLGQAERLRKTL